MRSSTAECADIAEKLIDVKIDSSAFFLSLW